MASRHYFERACNKWGSLQNGDPLHKEICDAIFKNGPPPPPWKDRKNVKYFELSGPCLVFMWFTWWPPTIPPKQLSALGVLAAFLMDQ